MPLLAGVTAEEDVASPPTGEISTGEAPAEPAVRTPTTRPTLKGLNVRQFLFNPSRGWNGSFAQPRVPLLDWRPLAAPVAIQIVPLRGPPHGLS